MNIINLDQLVSMTSLEIAELTGKEHKHVMRDIRKMVEELNGSKSEERDSGNSNLRSEIIGVNGSNFGRVDAEMYKDAKGETRTLYRLDRKHTFVLVAGYSVQLRARCYDHIQMLEQKVFQLEDQQKRAAIQSANRRGVTWGDYCKTHGLPAQKLMSILKHERKLFQVHPVSGEWSVNPAFAEYFRVIKPTDQRFNPSGINIRFNAKGLAYFSQPEHVLKMRGKVIAIHGTDAERQKHLQDVGKLQNKSKDL
ncbi:TPA: Rha family transcriptional regulator [Klebsiella pneumoniae]|nr:Rha family transcriptional regulator [Klebsiella pneumoniae]HBW7343081.1 Rha family transcriptional regulator [Klebsiella pneumoniae]HBW7348887.1 Rha family transcriptional regulator [Klebsiella pneumoniae]HBW7397221.1 Rha family transcriptional regulator [Klebsiella pneumoniae]